ncbi:unnamed protein product [Cladocopium goreaui]|uniref:Uncharacterized protein n=1 Tax=Cladocopium goreaui TaxID=2562237 RepID=A0A9P1C7V0_9DINO|nr:unnamed protein product [Cladocopium goreaui]
MIGPGTLQRQPLPGAGAKTASGMMLRAAALVETEELQNCLRVRKSLRWLAVDKRCTDLQKSCSCSGQGFSAGLASSRKYAVLSFQTQMLSILPHFLSVQWASLPPICLALRISYRKTSR